MPDFIMCNPSDVITTAKSFAQNILRNKGALEAVVESIHATGVSRWEYARSVAMLAMLIKDNLEDVDPEVARDFRMKLSVAAYEAYVEYWSISLGNAPKEYAEPGSPLASADPIIICEFIGDLYHTRIIDRQTFINAVEYLLHCAISELHMRCLHSLFVHAYSKNWGDVDTYYLYAVSRVVRQRYKVYSILGPASTIEEEEDVERLFFTLARGTWTYLVDKSLDLNEALAASVFPRPRYTDDDRYVLGPDTAGLGDARFARYDEYLDMRQMFAGKYKRRTVVPTSSKA